ncbi:MAG: TonB-dependent receptor [Gammaproteobacteria bacterium]|nr:TonB-dependent receptor [Gammaproteobacteria bacterium]
MFFSNAFSRDVVARAVKVALAGAGSRALLACLCFAGGVAAAGEIVEEIVVVETLGERLGTAGSVGGIDTEALAEIRPTHIHEALVRIPGVWVSRGSGHEHLTAIRSAVLTGAGACGAFLFLEDGLPIRPAGFCNVNNLFEVNGEQAGGIEVWRGPASAALGGNALHGAINVSTPDPEVTGLSLEGGSYGYAQVRGALAAEYGDHRVGLSAHGSHSNGYRDDTGYGQQKLSLVHETGIGAWQVRNTLNASNLNQETGGFVRGYKAYDDGDLRSTNPNPEAYRDAWSVRAASHWSNGVWRITPYARRSRMVFLQHFLPGQPTETNEQGSGGILATYAFDSRRMSGHLGAHLEYMEGSLTEIQDGPTTGSAFLVGTRPPGRHYDYDVDSIMGAVFYDLDWRLGERWRALHGLRVESLGYDYDNNHLVGNTRDDGSRCGFGGCLYTRPPSGDDSFTEVAGRVGIEREFGAGGVAYLTAATGFRPPQITELYRLQRGQTVADLESQRLVSFEAGLKAPGWSVSVFRERTRHYIFREANGFNVSDGRTRSAGVEFSAEWGTDGHLFSLAGTYAVHEYDFSRRAGGGEVIEKGNRIDTAPRWLGSARWRWQPGDAWYSEFEVNVVGKHFINAANSHSYPGHAVVNWRGGLRLGDRTRLFARIVNLFDTRYADRADFAFGSYRYFPAMPIQGYLGIELEL